MTNTRANFTEKANGGGGNQSNVLRDRARRVTKEGDTGGEDLLRQLEISETDSAALLESAGFKRLAARWEMEFPANIKWYDHKIPTQNRLYNVWRGVAIAIGVATLVVTTALVLKRPNVSVSQFGVLVAGIFGVMQVLAASGDPKARLGGFRKARADLKEAMFTFVESWTGRVFDAEDGNQGKDQLHDQPLPRRPSPDFVTALLQEIRSGRKISREERDTYFATFKSPTEILGAANTALDALRARRTELGGAIKEAGAAEATHDQAVSTRIQDLRNKLAEATAQREALENKKARLKNDGVPQAQLDDVQGKIEDAETDRFKTQRLLDLAVKSDVAYPI